jgi:hypothetical protein
LCRWSGRSRCYGAIRRSTVAVNFTLAGFSGAAVSFGGAEFSGGAVSFYGARFSGGTVGFGGAEFSGGAVSFSSAEFSGGTVDFSQVAVWTDRPYFDWDSTPPSGVRLPAQPDTSVSPGTETEEMA